MRKPFQSPGRMKNSSYYIAPAGDRTHDLPHTVASNMVKVSYAPNHSATAAKAHEGTADVKEEKKDLYSEVSIPLVYSKLVLYTSPWQTS